MKKILIYTGIGLAALAAFGRNKVVQVQNIAKNVKTQLDRVNSSNIDFSAKKWFLNIDLKLTNLTDYSFTINTGSLISLQKIELFTDTGQKIGEATKVINNIDLQPNSVTIIEDVDLVIEFNSLGTQVVNLILQNPSGFIFKPHVKILGQNVIL